MKVIVNGEGHELAPGTTLAELVTTLVPSPREATA